MITHHDYTVETMGLQMQYIIWFRMCSNEKNGKVSRVIVTKCKKVSFCLSHYQSRISVDTPGSLFNSYSIDAIFVIFLYDPHLLPYSLFS